MRENLVAVVVVGQQNETRVTPAYTLNDANRALLAKHVAKKHPDRTYYLARYSNTSRGLVRLPNCEPLYTWHVGEGFEHHEGWWVHYE